MTTPVEEHHCAQLVPIFQTLQPDQLALIDGIVHHHHYQAGEFLYNEGDQTTALSIVASGQAKVFQTAENGKEHLLYLLQAGDIDGEAALFSQGDHQASAELLTPATVCSIQRGEFQRLLLNYPQLSLNVLGVMGQKLQGVETRATMANTASVTERVADYLLETAASLKTNRFTLPLKKKDLAIFLGTTPETISRTLKQLETAGAIDRRGRDGITIVDEDRLS